jgi:pheromone a factor receptor
MALAGTDVIGTVPLATWVVIQNAGGVISPWISWENVHFGFSRVDQIPASFWRANPVLRGVEMVRWLPVACALIFFIYFGFADEARKHYRLAVSSVAKHVGVSTGSFGHSSGLFSSSQYVTLLLLDYQKLTGSFIRMSKGGVGSHPGSIPVFGTEKITRKNSYESFSDVSSNLQNSGSLSVPSGPVMKEKNPSFTNVFSSKKKLNEEVFKPGFQYDNLVLPDIGGTLANSSSDEISSEPTSGSSNAPSISLPEPAVTRSDGHRRHSHDMV